MSREFIDQVCQRWSEALQRYQQEVSDDEDFTYRAVLGAKGLFGDSVGALEQNDRGRQLLVDILERPWLHRQAHLFVALAVCDLAINLVEPSVYDAFRTALGQSQRPDFLSMNSASRNSLLTALRTSKLFRIAKSRDEKNLYIASLCRFVPAYKMRPEVLERYTLELLRELADDWLRGRTVLDGPEFRARVSRSLGRHFKEQRVGDVLEAFCQLLRQVYQVLRVASEMADFDDCSMATFSEYFQRGQGEPPLAGQPLRLDALWGDLRGLLGVQEAQVRTGPQGLLRHVRAGQILAMPDGTAVPDWLADASDDRVPWGPYPDASGRTLLVTAARNVNRFSLQLYEALLHQPLSPGETGLLKREGQNWLVASWPFQVLGGPRGSPLWGVVNDEPIHRFVCRDADRPEYNLYGTGTDACRAPVTLDGTGRRTAARPRAVWRLVETSQGMRPRLVVRIPAEEAEGTVSIWHQGQMLEDDLIIWEEAHSAALPVPPEGELSLHYRTTGRVARVPFRFEPPSVAPMLFVPSQEPGIWLPLAPHDELPFYERILYLVGRSNSSWQTRGFEVTPKGPIESPWQGYSVWQLIRQARVRFLRVGTMSRTWWETEARPALTLTAAGATEARNDLMFYRDAEQVRVNVRGYLGRLASDQESPRLRVTVDSSEREESIVTSESECDWSVKLADLLAAFGPPRSMLRRVTVTLQTPTGIERREPGMLSFCSFPQLTICNEPILRPDKTSVLVEVPVVPGTKLEYRANPGDDWRPVTVESSIARIEFPVSDQLRAEGQAKLPVRIEGIPFRDALTIRVKSTGLAVSANGREQFLGSAGAQARVDLKDEPALQTRELVPGESVCLIDAEGGGTIGCLNAGQPPVKLSAVGLHSSQAELKAWLIPVGGTPRFLIGTLVVEWTITITALDAVVRSEGIEVSFEGNLPTDQELLAVLIAANGEVIDEVPIAIQPRSRSHQVRFEVTEHWQDCGITVRGPDGSELGRCFVRADGAMTADVPVAIPPALELARQNWQQGPQSTAACDAYLAELLKTSTSGSTRRHYLQEIARVISRQVEAGDLAWWKSSDNEQRLERLLDHFCVQQIAGAALARAAFVTALAACQVDQDAKDPQPHPRLGPKALHLLLRWPVLAMVEPTDDLVSVVKGSAIARELLTQLQQGASGEWRRLGRFFERASNGLVSQIARALKEPLRDPPSSTAAGLVAVLLSAARPDNNLFTDSEFFVATAAGLRLPAAQTAEWRRALLHWSAEEVKPMLRDLQRRPPRVNNEVAMRGCLYALGRPTDPVSIAVPRAVAELPPPQRREIIKDLVRSLQPGFRLDPVWFFDLLDGRPGTLGVPGWLEVLAETAARQGHQAALLRSLGERVGVETIRESLWGLTTEQRRRLARACLDGGLGVDQVLYLFTPADQAADLGRWLEFLAEILSQQPHIPSWISSFFDALSQHEPLERGTSAALIRSLPPIVDRLVKMGFICQPQRASLALLLTHRLHSIDPVELHLSAEDEPLAESLVRLMVDDPTYRNSGMRQCVDFYNDALKNPTSGENIARVKRFLPTLTLLAAALRTRLEQSEEDPDAFDLACSVHKYLGKWYFLLSERADAQIYGLRTVQIYLRYLRSGRWENKTADVWEKIEICLARLNDADRRVGYLECARLRLDQGFWRAAFWWLARASGKAITTEPVPEQLDGLMDELQRDAAVKPLGDSVCSAIRSQWLEDQKLEACSRDAIERQRCLSILLPALLERPSSGTQGRMNAAVISALQGSDPEEEFAALLEQPGIPPNYRFGNVPEHSDFAALLLDGVQGEVRQQIVAWMIQSDPSLADVLRTEIAIGDDMYSTDVSFETSYSSAR